MCTTHSRFRAGSRAGITSGRRKASKTVNAHIVDVWMESWRAQSDRAPVVDFSEFGGPQEPPREFLLPAGGGRDSKREEDRKEEGK